MVDQSLIIGPREVGPSRAERGITVQGDPYRGCAEKRVCADRASRGRAVADGADEDVKRLRSRVGVIAARLRAVVAGAEHEPVALRTAGGELEIRAAGVPQALNRI